MIRFFILVPSNLKSPVGQQPRVICPRAKRFHPIAPAGIERGRPASGRPLDSTIHPLTETDDQANYIALVVVVVLVVDIVSFAIMSPPFMVPASGAVIVSFIVSVEVFISVTVLVVSVLAQAETARAAAAIMLPLMMKERIWKLPR
jgi:hypothetical protein